MPLIKGMIFINVKQLIKRIIKEETEQDLSPAIKELLERSVVPKYEDSICQILVVPPWKRGPFVTKSNFEEYEIMVRVVGGVGSKKWPETQFVHRERDKIVEDIWNTVYNYLGVPSSVFLRYVKSCKKLMEESTVSNTIKRRANQKTLRKYISYGEINYPTLCDDFEDGYEYADAVIDYAINELLAEFDEDIYVKDYYSDVIDYLRNVCRDEFGQYLIDIYKETCTEEELDEQKQSESKGTKRKDLDFFDLVDKGIIFVTEPFGDGKKQKSNWEGDSNIITLWNLKHPEKGQEWVFDAIKYPKPEAIQWWNDEGQFTLEDEKYNQILRSIKMYNNSSKQEQNESELTERCWKGYTQKGMKTMFGKKYPNCVKIKKKRVNESKMLDYLKQFLSGEVLDNYKKEKGRKEFQKLVDMAYKITSKDNPIEGMVGVLVGNIKKEMWGQTYTDPNSVGSRWNFTVVLKPLFTHYNPNNEPDYGERVLNFEKEFSKNIRGMGFEAISPIQHEKVKNYKVAYEWSSRLDVNPID